MRKYKDGLGYIWEVPDEVVPEFERRRANLLKIGIVIKLAILGLMIWFFG